jgi:SAM-dependent methyltransferase
MSEELENQKLDWLVSAIKARSTIKDPTSEAFRKSGRKAAQIIATTFARYGVVLGDKLRVLDFGAGSGRVAIPLLEQHPGIRLCCVDVDAEAIAYLDAQLPDEHQAVVNGFNPPLPFGDAAFDCVYSVSVWSHLPEALGLVWLQEIRRILRDGGLAVITTAGFGVLEQWRKTALRWRDIDASVLERERFIYRQHLNLTAEPAFYPGISGRGSWGNTAIHPAYVRERWSEFFQVLEIAPAAMVGGQDIIVLRT